MKMKMKIAIVNMLSIFIMIGVLPLHLQAGSVPFELVIKVNEQGFFDANGKALGERVEIPKEQKIKLIFEHVGKPEEEHEFVLLFDSDEEISSGMISSSNPNADIVFRTGEEGELYDVFCVVVDCDGMEHLIDLILVAT
ncbi:hypothetical protein MNBD_NITROSPIRAE01-1885 [hydrothermal vent metagenome]|uniref:EfeO-type cupredoxin-like domain-containing protein n=1 Tax=hydrothermal vent metagenome TaxID=652676 RepID=A0A3B1DTV9_9ZZZZ